MVRKNVAEREEVCLEWQPPKQQSESCLNEEKKDEGDQR